MPHPPGAAVWEVLLTVEASVTRGAGAGEGGHVVCAGAWTTGAAQTLIHVSGAAGTSKAREAGAGKGAHSILTGAAIQAWVCGQKGGGLGVPVQPELLQLDS
uniref:Uncharacterized protein n=1 Tax=Catagonus wagneri TaxID=51154 RepID=A0A8C3WAE0_9CETA